MEEPELRRVSGLEVDHGGRTLPATGGEPLLLAHHGAKHAAEAIHQVLGRAEVEHRRRERLTQDDRPRRRANELRHAQDVESVTALFAEENAEIVPSPVDSALVGAAHDIGGRGTRSEIPRGGGRIAFDVDVGDLIALLRERHVHVERAVRGCRRTASAEEAVEAARGEHVANGLAHPERRAVGEDRLEAVDVDLASLKRPCVELEVEHPPVGRGDSREPGREQTLVIRVLPLKVVRLEEEAIEPQGFTRPHERG